ncbi:MAG: hypothetical protein AAF602_27105 [Myxococcota bacterium]
MRNVPPPSLVAAALEAADDASARFVLADWLQDHGDPYGEWLMSWLQGEPVDPDRVFAGQLAIHRALFEGWPRQHALVTWRSGFVRELVVRLPGVPGTRVAEALGHPTCWLMESVTFAAARLPLFESGVLDEMVDAVVDTGPHRRLATVVLAGFALGSSELAAAEDRIAEVAPRLRGLSATTGLDTSSREWFDIVDRLDERHLPSAPGPFSPSSGDLGLPMTDDDEETLWLEHTQWCDWRDDDAGGA